MHALDCFLLPEHMPCIEFSDAEQTPPAQVLQGALMTVAPAMHIVLPASQ